MALSNIGLNSNVWIWITIAQVVILVKSKDRGSWQMGPGIWAQKSHSLASTCQQFSGNAGQSPVLMSARYLRGFPTIVRGSRGENALSLEHQFMEEDSEVFMRWKIQTDVRLKIGGEGAKCKWPYKRYYYTSGLQGKTTRWGRGFSWALLHHHGLALSLR
ncbi:hypothetical protein BDV40DRAFT_174556 [Aspergillus tamarii]|uniref:Uncharacterized protein n=1 Tax=Aspergillus tamarii TaxID=41984 RepID=A0A5N6UTD5_ASPTM|nr:hypothetical protein BDV40DRAFT_174556 [Aspergillus tamarii]